MDDAADAYYIVVEGEVEEVAVDDEDEVPVLRTLRAGAAFGESALSAAPARRKQGCGAGTMKGRSALRGHFNNTERFRLAAARNENAGPAAFGWISMVAPMLATRQTELAPT
eukprot:COSAG04_NODE_917_length_9428_cov_3.927109_11_plen_112_part_00